MIISLATKKPKKSNIRAALFPFDFYRFRHKCEIVKNFGQKMSISRPLWVVGVSPFDQITSSDEGYVVHLGAPQFTARWTMRDETIVQLDSYDYLDEDLNIVLYETSVCSEQEGRIEEWLIEAVCAVAYTKGLIAISDPDETH